MRPPHVTVVTAVAGCDPAGGGLPSQTWQHADWLNRISIANKQDYARLQGFRFIFLHVKVITEAHHVDILNPDDASEPGRSSTS